MKVEIILESRIPERLRKVQIISVEKNKKNVKHNLEKNELKKRMK